jgi:hypothetical protein
MCYLSLPKPLQGGAFRAFYFKLTFLKTTVYLFTILHHSSLLSPPFPPPSGFPDKGTNEVQEGALCMMDHTLF